MSDKVFRVSYAVSDGVTVGEALSMNLTGSDVEDAIANLRTALNLPGGSRAIIYEVAVIVSLG